MKPGYTIENKTPNPKLHWGIVVYNWSDLNMVQNAPIVENSYILSDKKDFHIGLWKRKI